MPIKEKQAMLDFIWSLMGKYAYQFIVQGIAAIQPIATTLLFAIPLQRKKHYALRLTLTLFIMLCIMLISMVLRTDFNNFATRTIVALVQNAITLPLLFLCYEASSFAALQTWCMSIATSEVTASLYWFYWPSPVQTRPILFPFSTFHCCRSWNGSSTGVRMD